MEKFPLYLDTNIIYGYFLAKVKQLKRKTTDFTEPKTIRFLRENLGKIELFVSVLVKAEIFRRLRTELQMSLEVADNIWTDFRALLKINEIRAATITEEVVDFVRTQTFKKRISNILHLFIAKSENIYFVSGDKEIVTKGKKFYDKTLSYRELRKLLEKV